MIRRPHIDRGHDVVSLAGGRVQDDVANGEAARGIKVMHVIVQR